MNHEKLNHTSPERAASPEEAKRSQERIKKSLEQAAESQEQSQEQRAERAREDIERHAVAIEEADFKNEKGEGNNKPAQYKSRDIQLRQYQQTLNEIQQKMTSTKRAFSKVIHAKYIERASEITEKTVMRPNIVLGAAIGGFLGLLLFYFIAKRYGYELSGFEYIAFMGVGALIAGVLEVIQSFIKRIRLRD